MDARNSRCRYCVACLITECSSFNVGKTILASAIIDECERRSEFATAYVYCRDGDTNSNSALGILKGLAHQLLEDGKEKDLILPVFYSRRIAGGDATLRSTHQAKVLLEEGCNIVPKIFLIVDGLDECDPKERKEALSILTQLVDSGNATTPGSLRLLIVSQHFQDIQRGLEGSVTIKLAARIIRLAEKDVNCDINRYIMVWIDKIAKKHSPFSDDLKQYLRNLTLANAKGMYLISV